MPEHIIFAEYNEKGESVPVMNFGIYAYINEEGFKTEAIDEVRGDGAVLGTLIKSIEVPAGEILLVINLTINSLVNSTFGIIVESDQATLGGTETKLNLGWGNQWRFRQGNEPVAIIDNRQGSSSKYLLIYAPQAIAGTTSNNANTEYWNGSIVMIQK